MADTFPEPVVKNRSFSGPTEGDNSPEIAKVAAAHKAAKLDLTAPIRADRAEWLAACLRFADGDAMTAPPNFAAFADAMRAGGRLAEIANEARRQAAGLRGEFHAAPAKPVPKDLRPMAEAVAEQIYKQHVRDLVETLDGLPRHSVEIGRVIGRDALLALIEASKPGAPMGSAAKIRDVLGRATFDKAMDLIRADVKHEERISALRQELATLEQPGGVAGGETIEAVSTAWQRGQRLLEAQRVKEEAQKAREAAERAEAELARDLRLHEAGVGE